MITIIIAISLLQACSFFEKKIDYEPFVKALDEGDMKKVMSASDDGYAYVKQRGIYSTYEQKEDGEHSKTIYQTTEGVYNTKDKSLYGEAIQTVATDIEKDKGKRTNENYKKETIYSTHVKYENGQVKSSDSNLDVSYVNLIVDRLKGIGKLKMKPGDDIKKFDQPNSVGYQLTESEFQSIINDKLKINYDEYDGSTISLSFDSAKNPKQILQLSIDIDYKKKNGDGKLVENMFQIITYFNRKQDNNKDAKQEYIDFKAKYNETQ
ncbi:DUF3952 domain-containing protein [Bacillus thuringiensis]|uniref:DUF3952 domain-containing protein n=1 Tax=Bacillus thuringiensis HD-771 TaxID=1218175 RepID=A0A9W3NWW3_BACTU|nr:DUF3952 domain-containing protein [Bacillus thuringiensis]EEM37452.1 hypothetical protein bthur0004_67610 [Bacillus thuringiensis serovar sotto str. T04001]AFQ15350.1 hypothetical protein BTG_09420 [Bacillus thuringiensis HD-771]MEB4893318.1 DUF3952 domain-containing protein [Bacillus thuringiensis]MEC2473801.1 DUF3952 domain-containing protein [Bacillus thuringiensis]MEC2562073.1 DUF3952 domain-containing protein [Bacillus thuringiensis]